MIFKENYNFKNLRNLAALSESIIDNFPINVAKILFMELNTYFFLNELFRRTSVRQSHTIFFVIQFKRTCHVLWRYLESICKVNVRIRRKRKMGGWYKRENEKTILLENCLFLQLVFIYLFFPPFSLQVF